MSQPVPGTLATQVSLEGPADAIAFTEDSARFACGGAAFTIEVRPTGTADPLTLPCSGSLTSLAFSPDAKTLAAADFNVVKLFDIQGAGVDAKDVLVQGDRSVNWVRFTADGKKLIVATDTHIAVFSEPSFDSPVAQWDLDLAIVGLDVSRDGALLAVAVDQRQLGDTRNDGYAAVFDLTSYTERCRLTPGAAVTAVAFSPDGALAACTYASDPTGTVGAFTTAGQTGSPARQLTTPDGWELARNATVLAYGTGNLGPVVVIGTSDGIAEVIDATSQTHITSSQHEGSVSYVALAPNGGWAASIGTDNVLNVFNATADGEVYLPPPQVPEARALMFSPDNLWLLVGHVGGASLFDNTKLVLEFA